MNLKQLFFSWWSVRHCVRHRRILMIILMLFFPIIGPADDVKLEVPFGSITQIPDIGNYIVIFYQFIVSSIGIIAAVMISYNGFRWAAAAGNSETISRARQGVADALIGVVIALTSFSLLYLINPALTVFPKIVLAPLDFGSLAETAFEQTGTGYVGYGNCQEPKSGPCSVDSLQAMGGSCFGDNIQKASAICAGESGGNASIASSVDRCQPGGEAVSYGLFQVNLTAHTVDGVNCTSAFSGGPYTGSDHTCTVVNQTLYTQCQKLATDPMKNIQKACGISTGGEHWGQWGYNSSSCHFTK